MDRVGSKPLRLDMFVLDQAVLEVRYDAAYLLWDRSGQVWHEISKAESKLRPLETEPNRTSFVVDDRSRLSVNIDRSSVVGFFPERNLAAFAKECDRFFSIALHLLEVNELTRVGLRLIYSREYPRIEDAGKAIADLKLTVLPPAKTFGIETSQPRPEYTLRCEDSELGFIIKIRSETQTTEVNPALGIRELKHERSVRHRLVFDLDHYTVVPLRQSQFRPGEWIKDRLHATNRDNKGFLGG